MKVKATLNNYQIGSYAYRCLSQHVVDTKRIDSHHTEVVWSVNQSEYSLLKKAIGRSKLTIL